MNHIQTPRNCLPFLGVARNTGDALTFTILTCDGQRLQRSVLRPAHGQSLAGFPNLRVTHEPLDIPPEPPYPSHLPTSRVHRSPIQGGIEEGTEDVGIEEGTEDVHTNTQDQQENNQPRVEDPRKGLQLDNLNVEIDETTNEDEPPHPIEGRPKQQEKRVEWSETVTEHQKIRRNRTEKAPMLFSAEKLPLAKELSHKRSKRKKC